MSLYDISVQTIDGKEEKLSKYKDQVLLVVNVASQCGFTNQYEGLQDLYKKHARRGLVVLGFPCNQFGEQEPDDENKIKTFCERKFAVTFPMFSKVSVNGPDTHPLFAYLKKHQKGLLGTEAIKWNFTKFLVDKQGQVIERYAPQTTPAALEKDILPLLGK